MRLRPLVPALVVITCAWAAAVRPAAAQVPPELGQGWLPELTLTARHVLELAEATPAEKYGWRPAPGVRSIAEVYVHLAAGNLWLLERAGVKSPELATLPADPETHVTDKTAVIAWLRKSFDAVTAAYATADRQRTVVFFGKETTADAIFLRILVHDNEHLGQAIAYARMNGVVPPWSR